MLRSLDEVLGYELRTADEIMGKVKDFLFDDIAWTVRYLVADTGSWLTERLVVISPASLSEPDWQTQRVPVTLTKQEVENSPPIKADLPVSRQDEITLVKHYGWVAYWEVLAKDGRGDPHLRSAREVIGYHIEATDGDIGHVEDFIAETETWTIRYMVVDTRNWLPGRKVLVAPAWITNVEWGQSKVRVLLTREQVKNSPEFDPRVGVNRHYEQRLYDYYGRPKYWP